MLNSFASDLDSILNDLSVSPTPASRHSSCPDLVPPPPPPTPPPPAPPPPPLSTSPAGVDETDAEGLAETISLLERLIRSHPIWYLPKMQRLAAAQLLQHQEQGVR